MSRCIFLFPPEATLADLNKSGPIMLLLALAHTPNLTPLMPRSLGNLYMVLKIQEFQETIKIYMVIFDSPAAEFYRKI